MIGKTRRIGVVGIDGCGKSSFIQKLRETLSAEGDCISITCPDFHDTPNAPMEDLSRQLKAFSDGADVIAQPVVKASALYLQMTLYGPVEQFFVQTYRPEVFVCERHPVVETLVYGPLYAELGRSRSVSDDDERAIADLLDAQRPESMATILTWYRRHAEDMNLPGTVWDILPGVVELVGQGPAAAIAGFGARYQTTLPEDILWLDVPPELAAQRCALRAGESQLEAHETPELLTFLRNRYLLMRDLFAEHAPQTRFHVIDAGERSPADLVSTGLACVGLR